MKIDYTYRGIYDENEVSRIQDLLDQQRAGFNQFESGENSLTEKTKRYGVILLGATVLLVTLRIILK